MIPINIINLGNGSININDSLVKSVDLFSTSTNSFLTINKKDANKKFEIVVGSGNDELAIVVSTGTGGSTSSKLVVIDPGHGGTDPGAVFGQYFEKVYNLDIALRCEKILKSKGVDVALTRTTDKTMSLNERVKFANDKNAYLFVSIHNNSMPSGIKGSMVLYHYTSYRGKPCAQIMLDNLVKDLGTAKIGIQGRQNTVVLRDTKMPAILAEVACMSDPADLALLNTDSFIQRAAESIANSIIQILNSGI
jgi:N-acetylmuramoyl-L-alanine amidase